MAWVSGGGGGGSVAGGREGPGSGVWGAGAAWGALAGEGCEGLGGEVAAGDCLAEVADGGGEGPLAGGAGQAAHGQAAEALVVLEVAVERLADVGAPPVGADPVLGCESGGHRGDRRVLRLPGRFLPAGGFLQVAGLAGGDQPVRPGAGEVVPGQVAGVGQHQADPPVPG